MNVSKNIDALTWIDVHSKDGAISEAWLNSIAINYAGFIAYDTMSGERWYCYDDRLNGFRCHAVISRDGMTIKFKSSATLKRDQKKDAALMRSIVDDAIKEVRAEIEKRGLTIKPKKQA